MSFRFTLRRKLVLISSLLMFTPLVVVEYIKELENFLKSNLEQNLQLTAQSLAMGLHNRPDILEASTLPTTVHDVETSWSIHALGQDAALDGYNHEWRSRYSNLYFHGAESDGTRLQLRAGKTDNALQFLLEVHDDSIVYAQPGLPMEAFDSVVIKVMLDKVVKYFIVAAEGHGQVMVRALDDGGNTRPGFVPNIQAYWLATETGYNLELRLPDSIRYLSFVVTNKRQNDPDLQRVYTARTGFNRLLVPTKKIQQFVHNMMDMPGRRIWIVDDAGHVVLRRGDLIQTTNIQLYNPLVGWLMTHPDEKFVDPRKHREKLVSEDVARALAGQSASVWLDNLGEEAVVASASHPIFNKGVITGAVVVDEASTHLLLTQRRSLVNLINLVGLLFFLLLLALIIFSGRLNYRLRQLRDVAEHVVDSKGQIQVKPARTAATDEVGDLARAFSLMVSRLQEYQHYLQSLASRLSHELRTPIAVIRSSLDLIKLEPLPEAGQATIARAEEGLDRLSKILTRMREASAIEDSILVAEKEAVDIRQYISGLIHGYTIAWPDYHFEVALPEQAVLTAIAPDLMAQAMDKLISNAIDFSEDKVIGLAVQAEQEQWRLTLSNKGLPVPREIAHTLFQSMVSHRSSKNDTEPHLGLGLFIVGLIVEFHEGRIEYTYDTQEQKVSFEVVIPIQR